MKREPLGLFEGLIGVKTLARDQCSVMQNAASIQRQAPVGDIVYESVPERVLDVREKARLVEEFGSLQAL
jgi:hypothetical protein